VKDGPGVETDLPPTDAVEVFFGHVSPGSARLVFRLGTLASRRLGLSPLSARGSGLTGLIGAVLWFGTPAVVTLLVGGTSSAPWTRWALVAVALGVAEAATLTAHQESRPLVRDFDALPQSLRHEADRRALSAFTLKWLRLKVSAAVACSVTALALGASAIVSPLAMSALPAGTIALLGLMLYELTELSFVLLFFTGPLLFREAKYAHDLFPLDPASAIPVQRALRTWGTSVWAVGISTTLMSALAGFLVGPDAPALVTVVAAFTLIGYLATFLSLALMHASLRTVVGAIHDATMARLQRSITDLQGRLESLRPEESQRLQYLLGLYTLVRDAPTTPKASRTLGHALTALIIPTLGLFVAVLTEVYAERFLEVVLP
jgi:hypothetical protein